MYFLYIPAKYSFSTQNAYTECSCTTFTVDVFHLFSRQYLLSSCSCRNYVYMLLICFEGIIIPAWIIFRGSGSAKIQYVAYCAQIKWEVVWMDGGQTEVLIQSPTCC